LRRDQDGLLQATDPLEALADALVEHEAHRPCEPAVQHRQRLREDGHEGRRGPVDLTAPLADPRLFIVEQTGVIRIVEDGVTRTEPFLDLSDSVSGGGEQGLLGLAFHPRYATTGAFFVNYTDATGATRVVRYDVSGDPDLADPGSGSLVLVVPQPFSNHNGGALRFGPDGKLYIALGDGGSGGDPQGNGQNPNTLLGTLLRIDVDQGNPYAIPPDNPFVAGGGLPEIWAYGLRNPWRFSFDHVANTLYIGDVGQGTIEEIDAVPLAERGINFGWNVMEGSTCFGGLVCDNSGLTTPVVEYDHDDGCSVTGGYVYRGGMIPELHGTYFYSDWCGGWLRSFRLEGGVATELRTWNVPIVERATSFGQDGVGELYMLSGLGSVYRIVASRRGT